MTPRFAVGSFWQYRLISPLAYPVHLLRPATPAFSCPTMKVPWALMSALFQSAQDAGVLSPPAPHALNVPTSA